MPIPFTCPSCGTQALVEDRFAGQTGPCGKCGQTITIPGFAPPPASSSNLGWILGIFAVLGVGSVCVIGILVALLLPALQQARSAARRVQSQNNLKQISLALMNYHDTHGSFPPPVVRDESGKALYSWRVLILPYLEQRAAYEQFDKTKAWDAPENALISNLEIPQFHSQEDNAPGNNSSYMAVVHSQGKGVFVDNQSVKFSQITDGSSNTLLVMEVHGANTSWAAPYDVDENLIPTNGFSFTPIVNPYRQATNIALADGSVHTLSQSELQTKLPLLIDKADGQIINDNYNSAY